MKVVYCFNASSIFICQNLDLRSKQEKCPAPTKLLQCLQYSRQRVGILFHASIQVVKVDTEMQAAILLPHQHHGIAPSTLAGSDGTRFQHFPQVIPNLLNQWWGNSSKSFLKGSNIGDFYCMFHGLGTAQFCWIK